MRGGYFFYNYTGLPLNFTMHDMAMTEDDLSVPNETNAD